MWRRWVVVNINTYPSLYSTHPVWGRGVEGWGRSHRASPCGKWVFFTLRSANGIDLPRAYTAATRPVFWYAFGRLEGRGGRQHQKNIRFFCFDCETCRNRGFSAIPTPLLLLIMLNTKRPEFLQNHYYPQKLSRIILRHFLVCPDGSPDYHDDPSAASSDGTSSSSSSSSSKSSSTAFLPTSGGLRRSLGPSLPVLLVAAALLLRRRWAKRENMHPISYKKEEKKKEVFAPFSLSLPSWMAHKKRWVVAAEEEKEDGGKEVFFWKRAEVEGNGNRNGPLKTAFRWWAAEKGRREESLMLCQQSITSSLSLSLPLSRRDFGGGVDCMEKCWGDFPPYFEKKIWEYVCPAGISETVKFQPPPPPHRPRLPRKLEKALLLP